MPRKSARVPRATMRAALEKALEEERLLTEEEVGYLDILLDQNLEWARDWVMRAADMKERCGLYTGTREDALAKDAEELQKRREATTTRPTAADWEPYQDPAPQSFHDTCTDQMKAARLGDNRRRD